MKIFRVAALLFAVSIRANAAGPQVRVSRDYALPPEASVARDIRWAGDHAVYVAMARGGVVRYELASATLSAARPVIPGEKMSGGFFFSALLGVSPRYLLDSSTFGMLGWKNLGKASGIEGTANVSEILAVDLHEDHIVVLGADRDRNDVWSPDGAIAWRGSISSSFRDRKPILFSASPLRGGKKAMSVADCRVMHMGAVRFLPDGSVVVVPGVEPGAYLFDSAGRLKRTWPTHGLFTDECKLGPAEVDVYHRNLKARDVWLNAHSIVDDLLPLDTGAGVLVRTVSGGVTRWAMVVLGVDGSISSSQLPITSPSTRTHIRVDRRGDALAFLLTENFDFRNERPSAPSRIVLATLHAGP
jgi:hypothetical protein